MNATTGHNGPSGRTGPIGPTGSLPAAAPLAAIAGFAALLRDHGFRVGIAEQRDFVAAAERTPLATAAEPTRGVGAAWRAIACRDARDWRQWSELFDLYWRPQRVRGSTRTSGQTRPARDLRQIVQEMQAGLDRPEARRAGRGLDTAVDGAGAPDEEAGAPRAQGGASRTEALHDRSLAEWLPQDLSRLNRLAERIAERLKKRLTRRWHDDMRGRRLDLRRTLRSSLATGGLPLAPAWRRARRERPRLFILVDVSRSMETHAQLFLRIARAFVQAAEARVFVFHTRLAEVTPLLRRDSKAVQEKVNAVTAGFGGGTRIATSVDDFVRVHAKGQLGRVARVWVLSDGFDADPPEMLGAELAALARRGARITWFHPGDAPPASAAMQAAAPSVHRFVRLARLGDLERAAELID